MRALALGATLAAVLAVAASPAGASPLAYVTQGGFEPGSPVHALAVYDVATGMRVRTIDLPGQATDIAIDPTATRAYVATGADLSVVSLKTGTVLKSIPGVSGDVAVDPAGDRVYVTNDGTSGKVNVVNTATETLASPIAVDPYPRSIVVNPAGTRAYTGDVGPSNSLSVVDLTTDMETAQVFAGFDRPENLGISADGARVYAANFGASAGGTFVSIYEPEPTPMTTPVTVGSTPMGLTTNPAGTRVYVANRDSSSISVIDDATKAVVDTIPISFSPTAIAITPDGKRAVVVDSQDEKLGILDLATRKLVAGPFALTAAGEVAIPPAQPPAAAFRTKPGISREPTAFDASATQGGPIGRYAWTFGDGKHAGGPKPAVKHSYATAGTYTVKLPATNGCDPAAI
ncbi:MAG: hypothetical protein QOG86_1687, partial [Thermoleophilaceae bacterium]|nr:hypothetical protein [Thermoleophilaceae bacterium]